MPKYHNPSGFPENLPEEQIVEEKLKASIRKEAELFGYVPLETSAVEYLDTLSTKGDINKEIYTISRALAEGDAETGESDRALRFDLTVPFARYVAQHYEDLVFPFKRYQIQRVWRGERPQKGRFREFYQADIDVVANGTLPLHFDAEVAAVALKIIESFNLGNFTIHINNRKFLQGIIESFGISDISTAMRIIDKHDKVGKEVTQDSLAKELSVSKETAFEILDILDKKIDIHDLETLNRIHHRLTAENTAHNEGSESLSAGFAELKEVAGYLSHVKTSAGKFVIDLKIARGLEYYTGTVFETTIDGLEKYGSICSGGRYADLAGKFIARPLPGVGISIGLSRLLDIMKHEKRGGSSAKKSIVEVVIGIKPASDDKKTGERLQANALAAKLREQGISTEVFYKDGENLGKQAQFAEKRGACALVTIAESAENFDINNLDGTAFTAAGFEELLKIASSKIKGK